MVRAEPVRITATFVILEAVIKGNETSVYAAAIAIVDAPVEEGLSVLH